jgi:hypothetical protein
MRVWGLAVLVLAGCANAGEGGPLDGAVRLDTSGSGGDDGGGSGSAGECASGQLASNIAASGEVTCAPLDELSKQAIGDHCSAYLGWRDSCDGCSSPPVKWGRAGTTSCSPGVGTNNTCTMPTLGGDAVHMFGLDLDGDMDGNDKLYGGLHCTADSASGGVAPCPAGQLVEGFNGTAWTCSSFAAAAIAYVQSSCSLYLGWQDNCGGCLTPPTKWGSTSQISCANGAGVDNTCIPPTALGTETVRLFGLNPDGDVDNNDKFHVGLRCDAPAPGGGMQTSKCPPGQFVKATTTGTGFRCESAAPAIASYFAAHCTLYFGWHDSCNGCITPPTKWGKVRVGFCENGVGAEGTCSELTLGQPLDMFGLSPDGNVDENDVLYVGFRCD